ncbi:hypothetical protein KI387_010100, partial [Taxus chinensis]
VTLQRTTGLILGSFFIILVGPGSLKKIDELVKQDQLINGPYTTCDGPTEVESASAHGSGMGVPAANAANPYAGS